MEVRDSWKDPLPTREIHKCLALTSSISLPMVSLILQVNKVVKKKLPAIVGSIKVRTQTRSGVCGDFEGAIYGGLAEQTNLLHLPFKAFEIWSHARAMVLMRCTKLLIVCSDVSLNDLSAPYNIFSCYWRSVEQGYGGPSYLPSLLSPTSLWRTSPELSLQ